MPKYRTLWFIVRFALSGKPCARAILTGEDTPERARMRLVKFLRSHDLLEFFTVHVIGGKLYICRRETPITEVGVDSDEVYDIRYDVLR